jgi:multidrug efflux pump subunit AcrA (membrane-fusion protein)
MLINDETVENAVVIPLEMVQQEVGGKKYVFVVDEGTDGPVAKKIYVETGRSYKGDIVIEQGLSGGETLIVEGARGLVENVPLKIVNAKTEANNG